MENSTINAQINHSKETMEIGPEMDHSTTKTCETMEIFVVLHWLKREISHRTTHTANQEVINLTNLISTHLTIERRLVLHVTNKNTHKTITRRHECRLLHYNRR